MKNVAIIVPQSSVLQAIADPQYCFSAVNQFMEMAGQKSLFNVMLIGATPEIKLNNGQYAVFPDKLITDTFKADLVFIPALFGDLPHAIELNKPLTNWITKQYEAGAELASLCLGAFLLASTGLLAGKKCSTHWGFSNQFKAMFPDVDLQDGQIITEENRIYSSGGANSYWNLLLHLVEKYSDRATAIMVSKYFAIDIDRNSQSAFAMFSGQKAHKDETVSKAQEYIETNIEARITVEELAEKVALGRRSLERRFKQATHNTVMEYVHRVKMEAAKRSFESSRKNINEVMQDVGYTDTKAFRSKFKQVTGLTPLAYRNKYNRMVN